MCSLTTSTTSESSCPAKRKASLCPGTLRRCSGSYPRFQLALAQGHSIPACPGEGSREGKPQKATPAPCWDHPLPVPPSTGAAHGPQPLGWTLRIPEVVCSPVAQGQAAPALLQEHSVRLPRAATLGALPRFMGPRGPLPSPSPTAPVFDRGGSRSNKSSSKCTSCMQGAWQPAPPEHSQTQQD